MELSDLRFFESVARLGGMNKAAVELNTVQSNVTARIRALEHELGVALFHRHSRGVELTKAGFRLLPYASKAAWVLAEAKRAVLDQGVPSGRLALGSLETTASLRLSPVITRFSLAHPAVDISLRVGPNQVLKQQILDHALDGAFVCAPVEHPDIISEPVFREELVIAQAVTAGLADAPLASGCKILVKAPGCAYRDRLIHLLESERVSNYTTMEFGTLDAIIGCVEAGLGITMLPRSLLVAAERSGRVRLQALPQRVAAVDTIFIRRRDALEFSGMKAFLGILREEAARASLANTPEAA